MSVQTIKVASLEEAVAIATMLESLAAAGHQTLRYHEGVGSTLSRKSRGYVLGGQSSVAWRLDGAKFAAPDGRPQIATGILTDVTVAGSQRACGDTIVGKGASVTLRGLKMSGGSITFDSLETSYTAERSGAAALPTVRAGMLSLMVRHDPAVDRRIDILLRGTVTLTDQGVWNGQTSYDAAINDAIAAAAPATTMPLGVAARLADAFVTTAMDSSSVSTGTLQGGQIATDPIAISMSGWGTLVGQRDLRARFAPLTRVLAGYAVLNGNVYAAVPDKAMRVLLDELAITAAANQLHPYPELGYQLLWCKYTPDFSGYEDVHVTKWLCVTNVWNRLIFPEVDAGNHPWVKIERTRWSTYYNLYMPLEVSGIVTASDITRCVHSPYARVTVIDDNTIRVSIAQSRAGAGLRTWRVMRCGLAWASHHLKAVNVTASGAHTSEEVLSGYPGCCTQAEVEAMPGSIARRPGGDLTLKEVI